MHETRNETVARWDPRGAASRGTDVMSFQKTPGGTRGARTPPSNAVTRALARVMTSWHRRSGDRFQGMDLL